MKHYETILCQVRLVQSHCPCAQMEDRGSGYPPEVHEIILVPSMGSLSGHQPIYANIYIYLKILYKQINKYIYIHRVETCLYI